jgi:hypothetical protein
MNRLWGLTSIGAFALLAGCTTYPYDNDFASCDNAAGQCYRGCESYEGTPDYGRCHDDCDFSADRCFDSAYAPYRSGYYGGYGPSPWYGSYGYWYPDTGYFFSFGGSFGDPYYRPRRPHRPHPPEGGTPPSSGGGTPPPPGGGTPPPPPPGGGTPPPPQGGWQQPPAQPPVTQPPAPPPTQDRVSPRGEDGRQPRVSPRDEGVRQPD